MGNRLTQQVLRVRTTSNPKFMILDDYMPEPSDPFNNKFTLMSAHDPTADHVHSLDFIQVVKTPGTKMPDLEPGQVITVFSKKENLPRLVFELDTVRKFGDSWMLGIEWGSSIQDRDLRVLRKFELFLSQPLASAIPLTECRYNCVISQEKVRVAYTIHAKAKDNKIIIETHAGLSQYEALAFISAVVQVICLSNPCASFYKMVAKDITEHANVYTTQISADIGQVRVSVPDASCYIELPAGFKYFDQYGVLLLENYYRIKALQTADVPEWLRLELLCIYLTKQFELLCKSAANGADPLRAGKIKNARDAYIANQTLQMLVTEVSSVLNINWPTCLNAELFGRVLVTTRNSFVHSYDNPIVWNAKHPTLSANHISYLVLLSTIDQACIQVTKVLWEVK